MAWRAGSIPEPKPSRILRVVLVSEDTIRQAAELVGYAGDPMVHPTRSEVIEKAILMASYYEFRVYPVRLKVEVPMVPVVRLTREKVEQRYPNRTMDVPQTGDANE